jgi:uncharacterized membrane protein
MKTNQELKRQARLALKGSYWYILVVMIVISAIIGATGVGVIVTGPLFVGFSFYLLSILKQEHRGDRLEDLIYGFKQNFLSYIVTYILMNIFIFLWSLLLVIPGIIKGFAYSQVGFILADEPTLDYKEALSKSEAMMKGNKMRLFTLLLSFIGWVLLSLLTFGFGLIFLIPYVSMARAIFYEDLKQQVL